MEFKHWSWIVIGAAILLNVFGFFWVFTIFLGLICFLIGALMVLYLQHNDLDLALNNGLLENPLEEPRTLGLNLVCDDKPNIMFVSPNIKIQTETKKVKHVQDKHKKSIIDSGIELLFKKSSKHIKDGHTQSQHDHHHQHTSDHHHHQHHHQTHHHGFLHKKEHSITDQLHHHDTILDTHHKERKWNPFENIKIHTEKKKHSGESSLINKKHKDKDDHVLVGEDCATTVPILNVEPPPLSAEQNPSTARSAATPSAPASPRKKRILSGNKEIDKLLHVIIDYIIRDFIESWYLSLTTNDEFSQVNVRTTIEDFVINFCKRIQSTNLMPLLTTKLIDDVAAHTRLYRLANKTIKTIAEEHALQQKIHLQHKLSSPQRRNLKLEPPSAGHRRNKSDTDLNWYQLGSGGSGVGGANQKNVANSKFYVQPQYDSSPQPSETQPQQQHNKQPKANDNTLYEQLLNDPEGNLLNAFFDNCDLKFKDECTNENSLEVYLTNVMESVLYFSLPECDFNCLILRKFLTTILANVVVKPVIKMLADPDFINLQMARQFTKEPPPGDFFIKLIRQCKDLSELRACRQLITKEMDLKYKDSNCNAELASLRYTQKLIDIRISNLQNNRHECNKLEKEKISSKLPILGLDKILSDELALSYFLDYLSILNLQKYVIFYLTAQEWKVTTSREVQMKEVQIKDSKLSRDDALKIIRDKAYDLYKEYLIPSSLNYLSIDQGLIEVLNIKIMDTIILPENTWFDSICKFIYEKLKNEDVFLNNFYQSSAYKKLLLELDHDHELEMSHDTVVPHLIGGNISSGGNNGGGNSSDNNSGELIIFDEDDDDDFEHHHNNLQHPLQVDDSVIQNEKIQIHIQKPIKEEYDVKFGNTKKNSLFLDPDINTKPNTSTNNSTKHSRSVSDCTGMTVKQIDSTIAAVSNEDSMSNCSDLSSELSCMISSSSGINTLSVTGTASSVSATVSVKDDLEHNMVVVKQKLSAKIINTAIHCEGQYAVYAIQVSVIEDNQHKSWHIYRRYSKFLELKKLLVKRFPGLTKLPFPAKKTFQNTQRSVLEHRMNILNDFLDAICIRAESNEEMNVVIRDFLEPDTNDKKIHGGTVIRTIESLVNPLKSGMRSIRNMPDSVIGGLSKILLGKGPLKEPTFLDISSFQMEQSEYPALTSVLNLLDEVFDLQARSQWLRRGLINRLLGAPWVSHTANKKIIHSAKSLIEMDKIETLLISVLNNVWPDGKHQQHPPLREDNTKLRTRMAAKISLFALLSDDLKHLVGSETTRVGLLSFFEMLQNPKLNIRLVLVLLNDILNVVYQTDSMTKHVITS